MTTHLTNHHFTQMFTSAAKILRKNEDLLSSIDSRFGDGDHGVTITKIARLIETKIPLLNQVSLKQWFDDLGTAVMAISGGSAGPLYGTLLSGLAVPLTVATTTVDPALLKAMFASALAEMQDVTTAALGDKTMMDALIPAVDAALKADDNIMAILAAASNAAHEGAKHSERFVAKFGRARSYKEQTIGTADAGATSTALLFYGLHEGLHLTSSQ